MRKLYEKFEELKKIMKRTTDINIETSLPVEMLGEDFLEIFKLKLEREYRKVRDNFSIEALKSEEDKD